MSKTAGEKLNYAARRELRIRRDKTAALLLAALLQEESSQTILSRGEVRERLARSAVVLADVLIAELDRTRPDLDQAQGGEP